MATGDLRDGPIGGKLKTGNTVGVGRKRDIVRQKMLAGLSKALPDLIKIATGELEIHCRDMFGNEYTKQPNANERIKAVSELAKHALPVKTEVTGEDGGPIAVSGGFLTDVERSERIAEILDAARTRRDGLAPESEA